MAHLKQMPNGKSRQDARTNHTHMTQNSQHDKEQRLALELQREMVKRAQSVVGSDPLQSFDSSMSRDQIAAQFMKLAQRSREGVFA